MIASDRVIPFVLEASPGFRETWERHREDRRGQELGLYTDLDLLAEYLVRAHSQGNTAEFPALFDTVERLLVGGDDEVHEAISVGLVETIQNVASHEPFGARVFERWLGPLARDAWTAGQRAWEGKQSLAAVLREEAGQPARPELVPDISKIQNPKLAAVLRTIYRTPESSKKRPWWRVW